MRMPILAYFLVMGNLVGGLVLVSSQLESKPISPKDRRPSPIQGSARYEWITSRRCRSCCRVSFQTEANEMSA